jgi:glutamate synthase (NADPH/NADH) small chain
MDCGTPFCHWGCPVGNYIPEWNDAVRDLNWKRAFELLDATNILPEVTGRICPAPCEYACVLGINEDPVTVQKNELDIIEYAFEQGWVKPKPPKQRSREKIAVVGSGPAGLSCAVRLNQLGHNVTVFEKDSKIGGLLRFGIPEFKLEKSILDRRIKIWEQEGIKFITGRKVQKKLKGFDAMVLACGCQVPRDLKVPGRELKGIHLALEYLIQPIYTKRKRVVVIGGGDTGADCVHQAQRRGADKITQIEIMPKPPLSRPWPRFLRLFKAEKGYERMWSVATKEFMGQGSGVNKINCCKVDECCKEIPGSDFEIEADLVILALGFVRQDVLVEEGVFLAGDMRTGPSLIVKALCNGRQLAEEIHESHFSA